MGFFLLVMSENKFAGLFDVIDGLQRVSLALYLAKADIRQRYRRSTLGPFWITISTGIMIGTIGLIFGNLFKSPISDFLPFLAAGLITWSFISQTITEGTSVFVSAEKIIRQLPLPLFTHVLRMLARNFYIFLHNIVIFPLVLVFVKRGMHIEGLLCIPGLAILLVNLLWISLILGIVCARYRDLTQIVNSILQVFFYVTPIIWMPSLLAARADLMILDPNPFYHLIQIVRAPLLGESPSTLNWLYSIGFAILGWIIAIWLFNRYRKRVAYWL